MAIQFTARKEIFQQAIDLSKDIGKVEKLMINENNQKAMIKSLIEQREALIGDNKRLLIENRAWKDLVDELKRVLNRE